MDNKEFYLEDAMLILSETYHKILKINLTNDTHIDIKVYASEQDDQHGYKQKISEWLHEFALSGQVYQKDKEQYLSFTDVENIKAHFAHSDECMRLRYRRHTNGAYRWVMMEILKASDYTPENQTLMLYIRDIHDSYVHELETQKEMEYLCRTDTMTGLKNLYSYRALCSTVASSLDEQAVGVLFADLNGLKIVNDTMGHDKGNEYICGFSDKLKRSFDRYEMYRISGDEFAVVSIGQDEKEFLRMCQNFKNLINMDAVPVASIGFEWRITDNVERVLADAEAKMYDDKHGFYERHPEYKRSAMEYNYHEEMSSLVQVLTDSYEVLLIADIDKDSYHIVKQNITSIRAGEPAFGIYSERNDSFCNDYVSDDFRELRRHVGSIDNLKQQMKNDKHIICDYRLKNGLWRESTFWKMSEDAGGSLPELSTTLRRLTAPWQSV